jgi:hypothetical protein
LKACVLIFSLNSLIFSVKAPPSVEGYSLTCHKELYDLVFNGAIKGVMIVDILLAPMINVRPQPLLKSLLYCFKSSSLINNVAVAVERVVSFVKLSNSDKLFVMELFMTLE